MSQFAAATKCIAFDHVHKLLPRVLRSKLYEAGLRHTHTWAYLSALEVTTSTTTTSTVCRRSCATTHMPEPL